MQVSNIQMISDNDFCQVQATIVTEFLDDDPFLLWFRFPAIYSTKISVSGNAFIAALLLPSMVTGEVLNIDGTVSPNLYKSLDTIQDIYKCWEPALHRIEVIPSSLASKSSTHRDQKTAASFFSGGVDSLYTLLTNVKKEENRIQSSAQIKYLLLARGIDISLGKEHDPNYEAALRNANTVAGELNKKVLSLSTNIKDLLDLFVPWGLLGHGACLASIGLLFENLFDTVFISSTHRYNQLIPWGTHPLLDPLWSTEAIRFIHYGCEASRIDKLRLIKQFPIALSTMRVCFEFPITNDLPVYNCGICPKCLKTMIGLHIAGALDQCEVFPNRIDLTLVRNLKIDPPPVILQDLFHSLKDSGYDGEIKAALRGAFEASGFASYLETAEIKTSTFYSWRKSLFKINNELKKIIHNDQKFVIVDQEEIRLELDQAIQAIPFVEQGGIYFGPPENDETAIAELERLRIAGTIFIVIAWPAFWWLDYYKKWHKYLRTNFPCILENKRLIIFDLQHIPEEFNV